MHEVPFSDTVMNLGVTLYCPGLGSSTIGQVLKYFKTEVMIISSSRMSTALSIPESFGNR